MIWSIELQYYKWKMYTILLIILITFHHFTASMVTASNISRIIPWWVYKTVDILCKTAPTGLANNFTNYMSKIESHDYLHLKLSLHLVRNMEVIYGIIRQRYSYNLPPVLYRIKGDAFFKRLASVSILFKTSDIHIALWEGM